MTPKPEKLYVVVRGDLSPAQQAVQAAHALTEFGFEHKEAMHTWYTTSNHLALLSVSGEAALLALFDRAKEHGLRTSVFIEPDLGHKATAIVLEPKGKRLCRSLPLALRGGGS